MSRGVSASAGTVPGLLAAGALALAAATPAWATPRDHLIVAGSSTVYPFAAAVAERLGVGALVLPLGTGAGIAWFCEGLGASTPDVVMASRPMSPEEASNCRVRGVGDVERYQLGRDGIVLLGVGSGAPAQLSLRELWLALAERLPAADGSWQANPNRAWRDVRPDLPATPIRVYGPPATSGTRDALVSLALRPACRAALADATLENPSAVANCGQVRRDGAWLDAGEDDDVLVARLRADPGALGLVGFGAYARHGGGLQAVCIDGHCPRPASIGAGDYPLARDLYLYAKGAHRSFVPALDAFLRSFYTPAAQAEDGYLAALGLVPAGALPHPVMALGGTAREPMPVAAGASPVLWAASGVVAAVLLGLLLGWTLLRRPAPVAATWERLARAALWTCTALAGALLALVLASLVLPALRFFLQVSPAAFLFGGHWSPESAIRASQVVGEGAFGILPVLLGSLLIGVLALALAIPVALAAALHAHAWAGPRSRARWQRFFHLAALVPTVVYGLFAALTAGPVVAGLAGALGADAALRSSLAAGLVIGIMLLPLMALRIGAALEAVPSASLEAVLGLGATRWEALRDVVLPQAMPGIGAAVLFALGRALGETVIVLMALGLAAGLSLNPLDSGTTLTVQLVQLMAGTHELGNVRTQLPFVLGLFLAVLVLPLHVLALKLSRRSGVEPVAVY